MKITQKLAALRKYMQDAQIDACIVPISDPHLSEYQPSHWRVLEWLSGFTGSSGTVVVTAESAGLWTDSRYFLQAGDELNGSGIDLFKVGLPDTPAFIDWLNSTLPAGATVGLDGRLFSAAQVDDFVQSLAIGEIAVNIDFDPFPVIWNDRPGLPSNPLFVYSEHYAGKST
ncbi:MAG: aminopeptidase P family N-terminal domain-containing protein, partial [Bacteroidales bacterium]|nr:aminopeptidase P family N-terminal domain-containing protein [Bacteroidales bacterium]